MYKNNNTEREVYRLMLRRCYDLANPSWKWYGGKGVTVCSRWKDGEDDLSGFECFLADMGARPGPGALTRSQRWKSTLLANQLHMVNRSPADDKPLGYQDHRVSRVPARPLGLLRRERTELLKNLFANLPPRMER